MISATSICMSALSNQDRPPARSYSQSQGLSIQSQPSDTWENRSTSVTWHITRSQKQRNSFQKQRIRMSQLPNSCEPLAFLQWSSKASRHMRTKNVITAKHLENAAMGHLCSSVICGKKPTRGPRLPLRHLWTRLVSKSALRDTLVIPW